MLDQSNKLKRSVIPTEEFSGAARDNAVRAPELTIVVPTFCEYDNVAPLIECIDKVLFGVSWELIFVDDNSPDGTAAYIKSIGTMDARIRCIRRVGRRGLAGACIEGLLASQAPYAAVMDADFQHDERLLSDMLMQFRSNNADIVIGTRYVSGGSADCFSAARHSSSRIANFLARKLLGIKVSDPMSGFFMLRRSLIEEIAPRLSARGFKILMDILSCAGANARVVELPYRFRSRRHGESKLDSQVVLDFFELVAAKISRGLIPDRFLSFLLVGLSGIAVHAVTLTSFHLYVSSFSFIWMQTIATLTAMVSNFFANNYMTYRDRRLKGWNVITGLLLFCVICSFGVFSNISVADLIYGQHHSWLSAGLLGAFVSAVWNYAVSRTLVWRG